MSYADAIHRKAVDLAKLTVRMTSEAGSGHPSSGLSLAHIVTVLLYDVMRWDPADPWHGGDDRLVLSEGHAVPFLYAACCDLGVPAGLSPETARPLTREDALTLRAADSPLDGHPNPAVGFPLFDVATGSLGQGLSAACGLGLAAALGGGARRVYALIGDGESREGQVWEACDFLAERNLRRVTPVFNANGEGQSDPVSPQQDAERLAAKLEAFGLEPILIDGHDPAAIRQALRTGAESQAPAAVVARTVKGWGVREFQRTNYHGKALDAGQLEAALEDLDAELDRRLDGTGEEVDLAPAPPPAAPAAPAPPEPLPPAPDFVQLLEGDKRQAEAAEGIVSTRLAYGLALRELGRRDERVVALDGDVKNSTRAAYFAEAVPERFVECRIAEQNMVSVAAGLAAGGRRPFVSTFAKFLARAYDQVEMALISGVGINLVGSHAGANIGADGPSQMGLADANYARAFTTVRREDGEPLLTCFCPADATCAYACTGIMADLPGATYMRTLRGGTPLLYDAAETFPVGAVKRLREGGDVTLLATGYMVHVGLEVCLRLAEAGIDAALWDCYSLPLQSGPVRALAEEAGGPLVTLEDHYGGVLGDAVDQALQPAAPAGLRRHRLAVERVPKSGRSTEEALGYVGLDAASVTERVRHILQA